MSEKRDERMRGREEMERLKVDEWERREKVRAVTRERVGGEEGESRMRKKVQSERRGRERQTVRGDIQAEREEMERQ